IRHSMKRAGFPKVEFLEDRTMLAGPDPTVVPDPLWKPTSTDLGDVQHGPMANLGDTLVGVYQSFLSHQGQTNQLAGQYPLLQFQGNSVLIGVNSLGGDFNQFQTSLQNLGLQVVASSALYGRVDGWLPVSQLPTVAQMAQTMSGHPIYKPVTNAVYQGVAYNEAETAMFADVARTQFGVDGAGRRIGMLVCGVRYVVGA